MPPVHDGYARCLPQDEPRLADVLSESFSYPAADALKWFDQVGHDNLRVIWRDGRIAGGLMLIPMAQYWGGREVPLMGFGGVATAATSRGGGVAKQLMRSGLEEARAQGFPLAGLYPATQPLYRAVGFEQAGVRMQLKGPIAALRRGRSALPMREFEPGDLLAIKTLYGRINSARNGYLARGDYAWSRLQVFRGTATSGYVVHRRDALAGYVFLIRHKSPSYQFDIEILDWCGDSPEAWERLTNFISGHASLGARVSWYGGEAHPLLLQLEEQRFTATSSYWWMLRVLDVRRAFEGRGYVEQPDRMLTFEVEDPLFADNTGAFALTLSAGAAKIERVQKADLEMRDVGALAALFAGHRTATQLASVGMLIGPEDALRIADAIFVGSPPAMVDMF